MLSLLPYKSPTPQATFKRPANNAPQAEDPTIFAYETGNELGGPIFGDEWVPNSWTTEIATFVKSLAPNKLIIDGTYGINSTHFSISEIDIFSDHFYPLNLTKLNNDISSVATANRVYLAGEYDWTGNVPTPTLSQFYAVIEAAQKKAKPVIAGDLFWSLFMHDVPDCNRFVNHTDGFELQYGNPLNTKQNNTQIAIIRDHFFAMRGESAGNQGPSYLPAVACPGPLQDFVYV
jgi:mannan endo-1,4-beta-mannosidase